MGGVPLGGPLGGAAGAVLATLGLITPSIIIIIVIAGFLQKFRQSKTVDAVFQGLRPASTGLIGAACAAVVLEVLTTVQLVTQSGGIVKAPVLSGGSLLNVPGLLLAALLIVLTNFAPKKVTGLHPIVFIGLSAVVGVAFGFAGA